MFIRNEDWQNLIERIIAAYTNLQDLSEREQDAFRYELESAFCGPLEDEGNVSRTFCLLPA